MRALVPKQLSTIRSEYWRLHLYSARKGKIERMSWLKRITSPQPSAEEQPSPGLAKTRQTTPTVKFDASLITKTVKADLRKNIDQLEDISKQHRREIYNAALTMIEAGGNMPLLYNVLLEQIGMTPGRAGQITRTLLNKARALTEQEKLIRIGITHAIWMYPNAPCMVNPSEPTDADLKQDAAHKAANGKKFDVKRGLKINGEWTLPGRGAGCKCVSRSVIFGS